MMIKYRMAGAWALGMCVAIATATPAAAETQQGWYFGVSPGQSEYDLDKGALDDLVFDIFAQQGVPISSGSSKLEDSDTTLSIFGGYRFSPFLAAELGYVNLGTAEYRASGTVDIGVPLPATFNADFESKGFTLAGITSVPLGDMFDIHARLGVLFADSEVKLSTTIGSGSGSDSVSANSQDLFYGFGAALHFGTNWSVSLDWQQYKDVGKEDETDETDIDSLTLAVMYRL